MMEGWPYLDGVRQGGIGIYSRLGSSPKMVSRRSLVHEKAKSTSRRLMHMYSVHRRGSRPLLLSC